jgi:hypothetical protein
MQKEGHSLDFHTNMRFYASRLMSKQGFLGQKKPPRRAAVLAI